MDDLTCRIDRREAIVGIVGMGYVGLPLAHTFWQAGFPVLGFDIDPAKVEALQAGRS
jgi:UDP-N-acetyl-D-glucosamine dehydrogenase